ncbi:MAG: DUF1648 domain-containing protein [Chitinophagales bacterium]
MEQTRLNTTSNSVDKIIGGIGFTAILLLIGLPIFYYSSLPDIIPTHYGFNGEADGFGSKNNIWMPSILGLTTYLSILLIIKYIPVIGKTSLTTNSSEEKIPMTKKQIEITQKTLGILNTLMACTSVYIQYITMQTAFGYTGGLGSYFIIVLLLLTFGTLGYSVVKLSKE